MFSKKNARDNLALTWKRAALDFSFRCSQGMQARAREKYCYLSANIRLC